MANFLSIFLKEEETQSSNSTVSVQQKPSVQNTVQPTQQPANFVSTIPDQKFIDLFERLLVDNDQQGMDFYEFRSMVQNNLSTGLSEPQAYQIAFSNLASLQRSKPPVQIYNELLASADHYISILDKSNNDFANEVERKKNETVGTLVTTVENSKKKLEELQKQYASIQQMISEEQENIIRNETEINIQKGKLEQSSQSFNVSFSSFKESLIKIKNNLINFNQPK